MNNVIVDRLLWIPKDDESLARKIRSELTIQTTPTQGKAKTLNLYEEGPEWIGVPRAWGLKQGWLISGRPIEDRTSRPYMEWPKFLGDYRTGQQESIDSLLKALSPDAFGTRLEAKTGCLAGDTEISVNRARKGFKIPIRDMFDRWQPGRRYTWDRSIPTLAQRASEGVIRLGEVSDVWDSGVKETFTVTTNTGRSIRATAEHPFLTASGWRPLGTLRIGTEVLVNSGRSSRKRKPKYWYLLRNGLFHHPYAGRVGTEVGGVSVPLHRLVVEADLTGIPLADFLKGCRTGNVSGFVFLDPAVYSVHHVDHDHRNNTITNLEIMPVKDHSAMHAQEGAYRHVLEQVGIETVTSIKRYGFEPTFDISMKDEPHNFLANGFVVHNTGKTLIGTVVASMLSTPTLVLTHKEELAAQWRMLLTGGIKSGKPFPPLLPGGKVGHVQGDKWEYEGCHLVTAMVQTLYSRIGREPKDFYKQFGLILIDEGHRFSASTFEQVLRLPQAQYRLAVSATWRRTDGLECLWNWHIGGIGHRLRATQLTGQYYQVKWATSITDQMYRRGKFFNSSAMITAIATSAPYNVFLAEELKTAAQAGRRVLLVSHRTAQLEDLRNRLHSFGQGLTVGYYAGTVGGRKIKEAELEESKKCQIVLATYSKMAEGIDIPELDTLYLATPAKDIEQVVGRIQRPKSGKRPLLVFDVIWQTGYNKGLGYARENNLKKLGFTPQLPSS